MTGLKYRRDRVLGSIDTGEHFELKIDDMTMQSGHILVGSFAINPCRQRSPGGDIIGAQKKQSTTRQAIETIHVKLSQAARTWILLAALAFHRPW